ncbi:MAG: amidohydrolase [Nitrososphaerota archaeon]|nr:amidohydrolase [Candidatus Bathyarchaeota archaeon]MDW8062187.1 amidohydrolase [Nitrososphaerota archaeon]
MGKPTIALKKLDWIVTEDLDRRVLKGCSLYIEDGIITEISSGSIPEADYTLDGAWKAAIPGLVNLHTHAAMTLLRGYADDMPLEEWLEKRIWPAERRLTADLCYLGALLACMEMARNGTTCFLDMYYYPEETVKAALKIGLRVVAAVGIIDTFNPEERRPDFKLKIFSRRSAERFIDYVKGLGDSRVKAALGPHAPYTCSDDTLLWVKEKSEKGGLISHIHLAETRREQSRFEKMYGRREIEYLDAIGFLTGRVVAAHCVWLSPREINILASRNVKVAHCPISNLKLAVGGVAPITDMIGLNMTVGLGTDGAASNNSLDIFEAMKTVALLHKWYRWDPTVLPAWKVLDMATVEGYKALGIDKAGYIGVGAYADIAIIDLKRPGLQPIHGATGLVSNIVYACRGSDVHSTVVDGEPIVWDRRIVKVDEDEIYGRLVKVPDIFREA